MIFFDVTKTRTQAHHSGITRLNRRLLQECLRQGSGRLRPVVWRADRDGFCEAEGGAPVSFAKEDWIFSAELFSEEERPGFWSFLQRKPCGLAAVFYDAIPLRFPATTWPQSVRRQPEMMKMLAHFDRVWAISAASRNDLKGFWSWAGIDFAGVLETIGLGADPEAGPRASAGEVPPGVPKVLCVGILEPRKNQAFLLEAAEALWREGLTFELHFAGRINPHFGPPTLRRIRAAAPRAVYHGAVRDAQIRDLHRAARCTAFPTLAEGHGLPLLESLWHGVPCLASDLPVLRETGDGGGCLFAEPASPKSWQTMLRRVVLDKELNLRLRNEAAARPLPTWSDAAREVLGKLG